MADLDGARLDGVLERARFAPWLTILLGLVVGFLAFQGISLVVAFGLILAGGGLDAAAALDVSSLLARYAREFLVANTVGQFSGLLLLAYGLARLHTRDARAFLRLRGADLRFTGLALVGLVTLVPIVQWLGTWSDSLPWPEFIRTFESVQMNLIDQVLKQRLGFVFTIATMAVTPALCEEVFFRGYIQRQAERSFRGPAAAVAFSGIVFGLYHVRPTQALPLSILGIYLAYLAWRSGSLWPAILVHFVNNGLAVVLGTLLSPDSGEPGVDTLQIPVYIVIPAAILFVFVARVLDQGGRRLRGSGGSDGEPV